MESLRTRIRHQAPFIGALLFWMAIAAFQDDQSVFELHPTVLFVFNFIAGTVVSAGIFLLSLFFITIVGFLFAAVDLLLATPFMAIWKVIPRRWKYTDHDVFAIPAVYVFFMRTMDTCLWPVYLFRLLSTSWSRKFEVLGTSLIGQRSSLLTTYSNPLLAATDTPATSAWLPKFYHSLILGSMLILVNNLRDQVLFAAATISYELTSQKLAEHSSMVNFGPGEKWSEEKADELDAGFLGMVGARVCESRFRYMSLVLFDDGISRVREWGYDGWMPWLLSFGVYMRVTYTDLRCYLLLAQMVTRLVGGMALEFARLLPNIFWRNPEQMEGTDVVERNRLMIVADKVCCWCRVLDSWLGSMEPFLESDA
ncbi:hypothetical protein QBC39DRAFT_345967 [Podospora conica]|nr:hypothetical protein QBC39DRAFT_345967 [Schizothecium conicum]